MRMVLEMIVNKERFEQCKEAIESVARTKSRYTFDSFCRDKKLYGDSDRSRINGVFICCPFHHEVKPSLLIEEENRRFKCFGCGVFGDYLEFITQYDRKVLGLSVTKEQKVNELLKNDVALQARLGFSTIFQSAHKKASDFEALTFSKFKVKKKTISTYLELASAMQKANCSINEIQYAVILMQNGILPEVIANNLACLSGNGYSGGIKECTSFQYTLEDLNRED